MTAPVALLIFNRPRETRRVFAAIRDYRPSRLLVIADGPRSDAERDQCLATRAVVNEVDWDCEVLTNYSDVNLGCKYRVSSGLDWVFSQCEDAIILEDDCLPSRSFFPFCEQLLKRYRDDERVMAISGDNFQGGRVRGDGSYYFSRYPHCWGWASWRRAWGHYDVSMKPWAGLRDTSWLYDVCGSMPEASYWSDIFDRTARGDIDTWDYQWTFACWLNGGLTALPNVNLVSNVGFGAGATHTVDPSSPSASLPTGGVALPLRHPSNVVVDVDADDWTFRTSFAPHPSAARPAARRLHPRALLARVRSALLGGSSPA